MFRSSLLKASRPILKHSRAPLVRSLPAMQHIQRSYAEEAAQELILSFSCPHEVIIPQKPVKMVTVPGATGDFGILAMHVPTISALRPGVVSVDLEDGTEKKYFVSGGYVFVHPDSTCNINTVEAIPVDDLDRDAISTNLAKYQADLNSTSDETKKAEFQIAIEVYEAAQHAAAK